MTTQVTTQTIRKERQPGGDIPEVVKNYFAAHPDRFEAPVTVELDTVRIQKLSKTGMAKEDAEAIAFLLWRARMVRRYAVDVSWEQAIDHAWLRSELFQVCSARRKARIAQAEARRERLNSVVLTGTEEAIVPLDTQAKLTARQAKARDEALEAKHKAK